MTSQQFYLARVSDLYDFFRFTFKNRWSNHLRKKLGATAVDTLRPYHRKRCKHVSLVVLGKLESYASSLGYAPLSSEPGAQQPFEGRCPTCASRLCVIFTQFPDRGPNAR